MEGMWRLFCEQSDCSENTLGSCYPQLNSVTNPASCTNHALIIAFDALLLILIIVNMICKTSSKNALYRPYSTLRKCSVVVNGGLGLVYIGLGIWSLVENMRNDHSVLPVHWWVLCVVQGGTWMLLGLATSFPGINFPKGPFRPLSIFAFLSAGITFILALFSAVTNHEITVKVALDILTFIGASLFLLCTYKGCRNEESRETSIGNTLYTPLHGEGNGKSEIESDAQVTPFADAGFFSKMSFWWLNSMMALGKQKTLGVEDIPELRDVDSAESCYLQFLDKISKRKEDDQSSSESSILWPIIACNLNEILLSGFFALLKILAISAGPLLLNAFIEVAEGKEAFKYEGCLLALALLVSKTVESLSQRQWYFRTRLVGLKVRSFLTAAICRKQLRLSNVARLAHSGGEIMNYVTVDAYRIGEFPYWFHQTWTTSLQLCIALAILIHAVGFATIAALLLYKFSYLAICGSQLRFYK